MSPLQVVHHPSLEHVQIREPSNVFFCKEKWSVTLYSIYGSKEVLWRISGMLNDCMRVFRTPHLNVMFVDFADDVEGCPITEYDPLPAVVLLLL